MAEHALRQGLSAIPAAPGLLVELGSSLVEQERFREAALLLEQVVEARPGWEAPYIELADLSARQGEFDPARRAVSEAKRRLHRERPFAWTKLAIVMLAIPGELESATELLSKASRAQKDYLTHLILAALLEHDDPAAAAKHFRRARRYWPGRRRGFEELWMDTKADVEVALEVQRPAPG